MLLKFITAQEVKRIRGRRSYTHTDRHPECVGMSIKGTLAPDFHGPRPHFRLLSGIEIFERAN